LTRPDADGACPAGTHMPVLISRTLPTSCSAQWPHNTPFHWPYRPRVFALPRRHPTESSPHSHWSHLASQHLSHLPPPTTSTS
ncbi:hypothetical protein BC826DRAFT_1016099, partial [Russula brevipes]